MRGSEVRVKKAGFVEEAIPHLDAVYRFALRLSQGREDEAQDLVQDTFLRAHRGWEGFRLGTNCRAWLFTICRNSFLRSEERRGRRAEILESETDADVESLAATAVFSEVRENVDPEAAFFDSFLDREVLNALDALPTPFREAVVLSDLEGLSYVEIAEVLELPTGTVKSRLFRGRRLLQQALYRYALDNGYITPKDRT
ncbi:sigma-70 family RNA polymerase sigma factor [soil metagenome]